MKFSLANHMHISSSRKSNISQSQKRLFWRNRSSDTPCPPLEFCSFKMPRQVSIYLLDATRDATGQENKNSVAPRPVKVHDYLFHRLKKFSVGLIGDISFRDGMLRQGSDHASFTISKKVTDKLRTAATRLADSPNTYWGTGNVLCSLNVSWVGIIGNGIMTCIGVYNDVRSALFVKEVNSNVQGKIGDLSSAEIKSPIRKQVQEWLNSPALFQVVDTAILFGVSVEAFVGGHPAKAIGFFLYMLGGPGSVAIVNEEYWKSHAIDAPVGQQIKSQWQKASQPLKNILMSPAIFWCLGNFLLGMSEIPFSTYTSLNCTSLATAGAMSLGLAGTVVGLITAFRGEKTQNELPLKLNCYELACYSAANIFSGSYVLGLGFTLFGIASQRLLARERADFKQKHSTHLPLTSDAPGMRQTF